MRTTTFSDRLFAAVKAKQSPVVVGIDPDIEAIPRTYFPDPLPEHSLREAITQGVLNFSREIIDAVTHAVVAVKPQLAYFERLGPAGLAAFEEVVRFAHRQGLLVIVDGKRNDIAQTAKQYAAAYLGAGDAEGSLWSLVDQEGPKGDALTINPYLGWDGIEPFINPSGAKGLFVLVKTSNPSSGQLQDLPVVAKSDRTNDQTSSVAQVVGQALEDASSRAAGESGYGNIGAVVGATYPKELAALREAMPHVPFLIPGYGAQGGGAADVVGGFDERGLGAVVNASRSILYAYKNEPGTPAQAAKGAAERMRDELRRHLW